MTSRPVAKLRRWRPCISALGLLLGYAERVAYAQAAPSASPEAPGASAPPNAAPPSATVAPKPAPPAASSAVPVPSAPQVPSAAPAPSASPPPAASSAPGDNPAPSADTGELVLPKLMQDAQPEYPEVAKRERVAASVTLEIDIDGQGHVAGARVVQAAEATGYGFEEAALEAAKRLQFSPATEKGVPVAVTIGYRFRFVPEALPEQSTSPGPSEPNRQAEASATHTAPAKREPTGQLSGTLQEQGTRLPLSGIKITVFRGEGATAEGYETETDAEGHFRLNDLGAGKWRLLADPEGYYPLRTTEEVRANSRTEVSYRIERGSYNPYDVEVDTKRVQREVNHISIDARQAERIPGTFGDVLAVVKNFPGVARASGGGPFANGFVVRGSAPEDSRVLVSGVDVPLLYHFGDLRSVLPSGVIEKVNFYPGNFSVEYGRSTGGIVDIGLKDLSRTQFGGYADVNFFDASLYLEVPVTDDLSIAVAGRRSYIDTLLNAVLPDTGNSIVAPRYYDAQALLSYHPSPAHQFKGLFFLSDDKFEVLFSNPVAADAKSVITDIGLRTNFYRAIAEYKYVPSPRFDSHLKLSFGRDKNSFNLGQQVSTDSLLYQGQVREAARYAVNDRIAVRAGIDYVFQNRQVDAKLPQLPKEGEANAEVDFSQTTSTSTSDVFHSTAAFAELELKPWTGALLLPGLRFDQFGRTDSYAFSPRIVARQSISPEWTLKGGIGLFQQEPTFDETDEGSGNPDLGLEKAIHYSAGFEYTPLPYLKLDVTGFYKTLYDLVGRTDASKTVAGESVPVNYSNDGKGRVIGLEVSARHELHENLFAWVAYTLSKSERRDPGSSDYRLFDYDQTHILTLLGSYRLPRNWEVGFRFRYVTGNLYTPITGAVYDSDSDQYTAISGKVNSGRVDGFHQLDVRIDKRWIFESWMLNAYLDIQNVYNRTNVDNLEYNYDYSKTQAQQGLPIIPVLGLRGDF